MRPAVALQYALPHRLLSRLVYWATRWLPRSIHSPSSPSRR